MEISNKEVMRYLGYRDAAADERIASHIAELIDLFTANVVPKSAYGIWDCQITSSTVTLGGMTVHSHNLAQHLAGCRHAVLLAATLGTEADTLIRRFSVQDMEKAVIAQAVCAAMIEAYGDSITDEITFHHAEAHRTFGSRRKVGKSFLNLRALAPLRETLLRKTPLDIYPTTRFSPGYGDFDIVHQKDILNMLHCSNIGLTLTDGYMLIPSKSVTAVIGFSPEKCAAGRQVKKCERCCTPCALTLFRNSSRRGRRKNYEFPLKLCALAPWPESGETRL